MQLTCIEEERKYVCATIMRIRFLDHATQIQALCLEYFKIHEIEVNVTRMFCCDELLFQVCANNIFKIRF